MTDNEVAAVVQRELTQARGYESDTLATKRQKALEYYQGIMPAAAEGRSQMVSLDVADAVHATLAQICPVVRTSQVEFEALSQEDEQQAQAETDFVRISIERVAGYAALDEAIHDALLIGNGWLHVCVEEDTQVQEQRLPPGLPDEALYVLQATLPPNTTADIREGKDYTRLVLTTVTKRLVIETVPPEEMLFSESGSDFNLEQLRFVARRQLYTASSLAEMGIPWAKIQALPNATTSSNSGQTAREGPYAFDGTLDAVQDANQLKVVYRCFIRLASGTGHTTELREVWIGETSADTLINDPADYIPFLTGSAIPMPHRIVGQGMYDMLATIQGAKTHTLRQYMDNLAVLNASRVGVVEGQVNMSDLTNGRINGVVRMRSPDSIVPLPAADIGPQAIGALEYLDSIRTQRVGASIDFSEVQAQLMSTSATAAAGQLSKVEMMGGWFAYNLVRGLLLPLFLSVHRLMRTEMAGPVMAKIAGKWQQTDTSQWPERTITSVNMGLTTTEKAERMMALTQTIGQLQQMLATGGGGVITDLQRLYNAMGDWIRTANLGAADQYLIDPTSPESQQAQQAQAQQAKEAQNQQVQLQAQLLQLQADFELEKQRRDLAYKVWSDKLDAEIEEAKITTDGVVKIKTAKLSAITKEKNGTTDND